MRPLPFTLDRASKISLTDQVSHGILAAIRSGYYDPGERLPTITQLAEELEVSHMVIRTAVRRVADLGEIVVRPKVGIHVRETHPNEWRRHVLFLQRSDTFYFATRDRRLVDRLDEARVRVSRVFLDGREASRGMPHVRAILDTQPVDLAILCGPHAKVDRVLDERQIPWFNIDAASFDTTAAAAAAPDIDSFRQQLVHHCLACAVRDVAMVMVGQAEGEHLAKALENHGMRCEVQRADRSRLDGTPQAVERVGWEAAREMLARARLPELIYFHDDYACRGGLKAFLAAGIGLPDDLQLVTLANRGHCPVYEPELTRLEMTPITHGDAVAETAVSLLYHAGRVQTCLRLPTTFVQGGTTRPLANPTCNPVAARS